MQNVLQDFHPFEHLLCKYVTSRMMHILISYLVVNEETSVNFGNMLTPKSANKYTNNVTKLKTDTYYIHYWLWKLLKTPRTEYRTEQTEQQISFQYFKRLMEYFNTLLITNLDSLKWICFWKQKSWKPSSLLLC